MTDKDLFFYSQDEERWNIITHGFGVLLSVVGLIILLFFKTFSSLNILFPQLVFVFSLILLYIASTSYHSSKILEKRKKLKIFDHCAIYVLIAGSYTPFCLLVLPHPIGTQLCVVAWILAAIGIVFKLFYTGKFELISTLSYVAMGCIVLFVREPLIASMPWDGVLLLMSGGMSYILGAVLYSINSIHFNHVIFHILVLIGSVFHFVAMYVYT